MSPRVARALAADPKPCTECGSAPSVTKNQYGMPVCELCHQAERDKAALAEARRKADEEWAYRFLAEHPNDDMLDQ
jgi:hypothetical protein